MFAIVSSMVAPCDWHTFSPGTPRVETVLILLAISASPLGDTGVKGVMTIPARISSNETWESRLMAYLCAGKSSHAGGERRRYPHRTG